MKPRVLGTGSGRPRIRSILVLPTFVTMGNLLAGTLALVYLQDGAHVKAAWMVFLGMLCDVLDGRVARWTRSTSPFGAQLDSLADVVTFGVVPALLARSMLAVFFPSVPPRLLLGLVVIYVVGAALRLARYNVETARLDADERPHVTLVFRGLPSPAAAGAIASLVLLHQEYEVQGLETALLFLPPLFGLLMLSRFPYAHVANRFLEGHRGLPAVAVLVCTVFLVVVHFVETVSGVFFLYAASGPLTGLVARLTGWPSWAVHEGQDEAVAADYDEGDVDDTPREIGRV